MDEPGFHRKSHLPIPRASVRTKDHRDLVRYLFGREEPGLLWLPNCWVDMTPRVSSADPPPRALAAAIGASREFDQYRSIVSTTW